MSVIVQTFLSWSFPDQSAHPKEHQQKVKQHVGLSFGCVSLLFAHNNNTGTVLLFTTGSTGVYYHEMTHSYSGEFF